MANHLIDHIDKSGDPFIAKNQKIINTLRRWLSMGCKVKEYEVRANYGYGPETLTTEATYLEAKAQKKCYGENERGISHWVCSVYNSLIY